MNERERIEMDEARYGITGLRGAENRELYVIDRPYPPGEQVNVSTLMHYPGATWREPEFDRDGREAWCVVLPNDAGTWWTTWPIGSALGWEISGQPPKITVMPSINAGDAPGRGNWHGFIRDGIMAP